MAEALSVPMQTPLVGLKMDADTALYVGTLEGTIAHLVVNEMKYRALLELLMGEPFEATRIDSSGKILMELAVSTLVKQTGMDLGRAKVLVLQRWKRYNQEPPVVPQAVHPTALVQSIGATDVQPTEANRAAQTMTQRYLDWQERQKADAAKIPDEAVTKDDVTQ